MKRAVLLLAVFLLLPCFAARAARDPASLRGLRPLFQADYKSYEVMIGKTAKTVSSSGCGAVCLAMAAGYLREDYTGTPESVFLWAYDNGWYTGEGLSWEAIAAIAENEGLAAEWIERDAQRVRKALRFGYPVIARMGPGVFTQRGHYVLLRGLDEEGNVLVLDPASEERSQTSYPMQTILKNARQEHSFAILSIAAGREERGAQADENLEEQRHGEVYAGS